MKYNISPGHIVYIITSGRVEEANVITHIISNQFTVLNKLTNVKHDVIYGNDMFLTYKKANKVLSDLIYRYQSKKKKEETPIQKKPMSKYIICEKCGSVSNSDLVCVCRNG
jgi:hypothetical protein